MLTLLPTTWFACFDTLVEVLDVQRFALMIGEEGVDVDRTGAAGNLTDFASMTANFKTRAGVVSNLICVCG